MLSDEELDVIEHRNEGRSMLTTTRWDWRDLIAQAREANALRAEREKGGR